MNNSFSLQQASKTGNLDCNLLSRQNKLNLMAKIMQIKFENPRLRKSQKQKNNYVSQVVLYNDIETIKICLHPIEFKQKSLLNDQKRF